MRPQKARDAIHDLRMLCSDREIELKVVQRNGSHKGLVFRDKRTDKVITITFSAKNGEISAGVQRGALKYLASLATNRNVAEIVRGFAEVVRAVLETIFRPPGC